MRKPFPIELLTGKVGFLLCTRGRGTVIVNGQPYTMTPGWVSVASPILLHQFEEQDEDFELLPMLSNLDAMLPNAQKVLDGSFPIFVLKHPLLQVSKTDYAFIMGRHAEIVQMEELKDNGNEIGKKLFEQSIATLKASTFMYLIGKYLVPQKNHETDLETSKNLAVASQFMFSLLAPNNVERRVSCYAERAHLSVGHFSALIRQVLGRSPQNWIELFTINKAKTLLREQGRSIKEIAQEMGFPEQFTFRKYFKTHAGVSPSEFRQSR